MKKTFTLFLFFFLPFILLSQVKDTIIQSRTFLDVEAGFSFPAGASYPAMDTVDSKSGFARTGYYFNIALILASKKDLKVGLEYCFQKNPFDKKSKPYHVNGSKTSLGSNGWINHYLMPGLFYFHDEKSFSYSVRVLVGLIFSSSSVFRFVNASTKAEETGVGYGIGYGLNVGIGYNISPRVTVNIHGGYLGGVPVYSKSISSGYDTSNNNNNIYFPPYKIKIKKIVSTFNAGAGVTIKL